MDSGDLFLIEFKELLKKYNVEIYADADGDTHGVSLEIVIDVDNKKIFRYIDSVSSYDIL